MGWYVVSLRTYSLITHPIFLEEIERQILGSRIDAGKVPECTVGPDKPDLHTATDIARYLGVSGEVIRNIILFKDKHYRSFSFKKASGGERIINAPRTFLKVIQWWILDTILDDVRCHDLVYGFVKGRSFVDNARFHSGARHLLNVDVKDFFPSVRFEKVKNLFLSLGYDDKSSAFLSQLTTLNGQLPQGAPTSPTIANAALGKLDRQLASLAESENLKITRYADDITFSSTHWIDPILLKLVVQLCEEHGFSLNEKKTKFMGPNDAREITGLVITDNGIGLKRETLNKARGLFHRAEKYPVLSRPVYNQIKGMLNLVKQVGGRGTEKVIVAGERAVHSIEASSSAYINQ